MMTTRVTYPFEEQTSARTGDCSDERRHQPARVARTVAIGRPRCYAPPTQLTLQARVYRECINPLSTGQSAGVHLVLQGPAAPQVTGAVQHSTTQDNTKKYR